MYNYQNINQGVYLLQQGYRNDVAVIQCPYISQKIQVFNTDNLNIIHGAEVFWAEIGRQYASTRKGARQVINAVILGVKHCQYLCDQKPILCTLKIRDDEGKLNLKGTPVNRRLPQFDVVELPKIKNFNFNNIQIAKKCEEQYFWARFTCWNYSQKLPKGCIIEPFNFEYKTPEAEGEVLLHLLNIEQQATKLLQPRSLNKRRDYLPIKDHKMFSGMVFTIDPPNANDIEDGLSLEPLGNEHYQLGVHISDVTAFKHLIDRKQISQRGTSTYLPHKTIHMMPPQLVNLIALKSKKKRLAFSAFFTINAQGKIQSSRFEKTIVKSTAQLSYEEAQNIIEEKINEVQFRKEKEITQKQYEKMKQKLLILKKIAANRRQQRNYTQIFDKNEVTFQLDEKNMPINIGLKKRIQSQKIVEEFMIMTNYEVAKKLVKDFGVHSLILHHPKPLDCNLEHLNHYISGLGVKFRADNMMHFESEVKQLVEKEGLPDGMKQLLLLKAIQIQEYAVYTKYLNTNKGHFGLSLQHYTHFTSPLRRFADFMVHEQLEKCINNERLTTLQIVQLQKEIQLINQARMKSKRLKQLSVQCFINLYIYHKRQKIISKGYIIKLGLKSATIYVPMYNLTKEVNWPGSSYYKDKDCVSVFLTREEGETVVYDFQKNDGFEVEIDWQKHHQVQFKLVVDTNGKKVKI